MVFISEKDIDKLDLGGTMDNLAQSYLSWWLKKTDRRKRWCKFKAFEDISVSVNLKWVLHGFASPRKSLLFNTLRNYTLQEFKSPNMMARWVFYGFFDHFSNQLLLFPSQTDPQRSASAEALRDSNKADLEKRLLEEQVTDSKVA